MLNYSNYWCVCPHHWAPVQQTKSPRNKMLLRKDEYANMHMKELHSILMP